MTIQRYKEGMPLNVGQFVNFEGVTRWGFATIPCEVIEVKPSSATVRTLPREPGDEIVQKLKMKKTIAFVCDTQAEAERMREISTAFLKHAMEREEQLAKELAATRAQMIAEAMDVPCPHCKSGWCESPAPCKHSLPSDSGTGCELAL